MHFTREPIIETVITAREGFRLSLRSSKSGTHDEYTVEALEVVSLGSALFFRSLEKPKAFLLPVSDYEVIETRETRILLKSVSLEKSIKISGGRDLAPKHLKEREPLPEKEVKESIEEESPQEEGTGNSLPPDQRLDKKRDRRRHRRRRPNEERAEVKGWVERRNVDELAPSGVLGGDAPPDETAPAVSSPLFSTLIPPPKSLISETLARYKDHGSVESSFSTSKVDDPIHLVHEEEMKESFPRYESTDEEL